VRGLEEGRNALQKNLLALGPFWVRKKNPT